MSNCAIAVILLLGVFGMSVLSVAIIGLWEKIESGAFRIHHRCRRCGARENIDRYMSWAGPVPLPLSGNKGIKVCGTKIWLCKACYDVLYAMAHPSTHAAHESGTTGHHCAWCMRPETGRHPLFEVWDQDLHGTYHVCGECRSHGIAGSMLTSIHTAHVNDREEPLFIQTRQRDEHHMDVYVQAPVPLKHIDVKVNLKLEHEPSKSRYDILTEESNGQN